MKMIVMTEITIVIFSIVCTFFIFNVTRSKNNPITQKMKESADNELKNISLPEGIQIDKVNMLNTGT